jgi:hypothetical protein
VATSLLPTQKQRLAPDHSQTLLGDRSRLIMHTQNPAEQSISTCDHEQLEDLLIPGGGTRCDPT